MLGVSKSRATVVCSWTSTNHHYQRQQHRFWSRCGISQSGQGHAGLRPSHVVWLGEKDLLFTVGFSKTREREIAVWNAHDLGTPLELKRTDSSTGLMLPLYDEDTSIMFIPSRGESMIRWIEMADSAPYMTEGTAFAVPSPVAGAGLVPKAVLNVMQTEVVRILAVNANSLWPISVSIPRRVKKREMEKKIPFVCAAFLYPFSLSTV